MPTNVTNEAEARLSKSANFARVREREFVEIFNGDIRKLTEALGVTRKIQKESGSVLKVMKVTGTLQSGSVPEGEIIPLSEYATTSIVRSTKDWCAGSGRTTSYTSRVSTGSAGITRRSSSSGER